MPLLKFLNFIENSKKHTGTAQTVLFHGSRTGQKYTVPKA